jgi:hypothetical protein
MVIGLVSLVLLLRQAAKGWIRHSSTCCYVHMGSCGYVPLCRAHKAATSRGLEAGSTHLPPEPLGHACSKARALPRVKEVGGTGRQVVKSGLLAPIAGWKSEGAEWWVCILLRSVWFPSRLPLEGTSHIQNFGL